MSYSVERLSPDLSFGRVVHGLMPHHIEDAAVRDELRRYWVEDGLVMFRGGEVSEPFQIALSKVFGPLEQHPVREIRNDATPELITLVSKPEEATVVEVDGVTGGAWLGWHTDLVYCDQINHGGILRALQTTSWGGLTGFIDQVDAYNRLSDEMKERIEGLNVVYQMGPFTQFPNMARGEIKVLKLADSARRALARVGADFPPVIHPLVFTQPETGRKVLNLSPFFAVSIEGMDTPEGAALLKTLTDHILDSPAYHHKWSLDEMLLWDNWRMLHSVSPAPIDEVRITQRTTIAGDYALGRRLALADA